MNDIEKSEIESLEKKLIELQKQIFDAKIPIILIIESNLEEKKIIKKIINKFVVYFDPRDYRLYSYKMIQSKKYLSFFPYWKRIPRRGKITIFFGSYYKHFITSTNKINLDAITYFEHLLNVDNYQFIKIFIHDSNKIPKKYFTLINKTNFSFATWNLIEYQKNTVLKEIYKILLYYFTNFLDNVKNKQSKEEPKKNSHPIEFQYLKKINVNQSLTEEEYKKELEQCTKRINNLQKKLLQKKIPLILLFEGWDASGKGGTIRRLVKALDPRYYQLIPISAPNEREKQYHYLWRFWTQLPEKGNCVIFDRTWYGRVLVERIEGFCTEEEWQRAYEEINEFEKILSKEAILIKFWLHIDKEEQYKRFLERQNTPHKQWKITEEDWRNREKWDLYEIAVEEMIQKTNTEFAKWNIIEFNYKWFGRIKTLKTIIDAIQERI